MTHRLLPGPARQQFEEFVRALFSLGSAAEIVQGLRELSPPSPYRIRFKVFYSREAFTSVFRALCEAGVYELLSRTSPGFAFQLGGERESRFMHFAILPTAQPQVSVIVSVCQREDWMILLRSFRGRYPTLVPILLSQRELLQGISTLRARARMSYELQVKELSAREILETPTGKHVKTVREWTHEAWEQAMRVVSARRQIVTSISLAFHRRIADKVDVVPAALCKVSKRGEIDLTGNYDLIWKHVVEHVAEVGQQKLVFYSNRGLKERSFHPAPLSISYQAPVFAEIGEIRRLVTALTKYPRSMHSVQHGNPYAYVQVADAYDGSTFDVWALSAERITVVPRLKATEAAVGRLIQYIFDEFREGTVEEALPSNN